MIRVIDGPTTLIAETDGNIFSVPVDGIGRTYLTDDLDHFNVQPSWSYDGTKIVYTRCSNDPNAPSSPLFDFGYIWTMNADGSDKVQLTSGLVYGGLPTFSPDAQTIVFNSLGTGSVELWSMNSDGTDLHPLTNTIGSEVTVSGNTVKWSSNPSFSPDGKKIIYSSTQSGNAELWVMNADGSGQTQLTFPNDPEAPDANAPCWSPDGSKIAFWGGFARTHGNIFTMNPDGSDRTQLTFASAPRNEDNPAWSPDGTSIMFDSNDDATADDPQLVDLWIMNADGSDQRRLQLDSPSNENGQLVHHMGVFPEPGGESRLPMVATSGTMIAESDIDALQVDGASIGDAQIVFTDPTGVVTLTNPASFTGSVALLPGSDAVPADNDVIQFDGITVTSASLAGATLTAETSSGTYTLTLPDTPPASAFANWSGNELWLSSVACFRRGTQILTPRGEMPVEQLAIADPLITLSGEVRPIKWIGWRAYNPRFIAGNRAVLPICIMAGALGGGLPTRDLWLSPEHALYLDGALVAARLLIDGAAIVQAAQVTELEYFHIELDTHENILAEGAPAESYVECDNRVMFHNAAEFSRLYPDHSATKAQFCAPRLADDAAALEAIRATLAASVVLKSAA